MPVQRQYQRDPAGVGGGQIDGEVGQGAQQRRAGVVVRRPNPRGPDV
ncbi:hypothetical protein [Streptomyces sp. CNQ085]|nr:hypothetical protein [Streptomyces sp. CNQ085]MCI0383948.1 hypothetical protein [Streptomyces sp. CNQ085]